MTPGDEVQVESQSKKNGAKMKMELDGNTWKTHKNEDGIRQKEFRQNWCMLR